MARPVSVTIPHTLGKEEARRRIEAGFGEMRQKMLGGAAGMMAKMFTITDQWEGDQLQFEGSGMGQKLTGRLDVREDAVQIQIDLPDMLAAIADKVTGTLKAEAQKLLEKK
jgi:putative polyhydroxyalkanoate system protein